MANEGMCDGCGHIKRIYMKVIVMLNTGGGRKERRQKATKSQSWCRMCFDSPTFARRIAAMSRETAKALASQTRAEEWDKT